MSHLTVATTQMSCTWDLPRNLDQAEQLVRDAALKGAQVILLQELFATRISASNRATNIWRWPRSIATAVYCSVSPPWPKSWAWCCR